MMLMGQLSAKTDQTCLFAPVIDTDGCAKAMLNALEKLKFVLENQTVVTVQMKTRIFAQSSGLVWMVKFTCEMTVRKKVTKTYIAVFHTMPVLLSHNSLFITAISKCFPTIKICDGQDDFFTTPSPDELNCDLWNCTEGYWKCLYTSRCIQDAYVCDGYNDCGPFDESDEQNCNQWVCAQQMWKCASNVQCVNDSFVCDGDLDCEDEADEMCMKLYMKLEKKGIHLLETVQWATEGQCVCHSFLPFRLHLT